MLAIALLALLSPVFYSYTATMLQPSSLPLGVRSVEWLRTHHGNWLVDEGERIYYGWKAPKKGGRQLKSLPTVGRAAPCRGGLAACDQAGLRTPLGGRRKLEADRAICRRRPARPYHHVSDGVGLPAHRRVRRVVRPQADGARVLPGPLRAADCTRARADVGSAWPALAPPRRLQQRLHVHRRPQRLVDQRPQLRAAQDGLATLVGYRNGRVDVTTWRGGPNAGPRSCSPAKACR